MEKTAKMTNVKFEREIEKRATKNAEVLKYQMINKIESLTCCEGWGEAIVALRSAVKKLDLLPEIDGLEIEHCSVKDMVRFLVEEIEKLRK
jgi:hypothetical protein